jgi:hypothetical protein
MAKRIERRGRPRLDFTGQRFGKLVVVSRDPKRPTYWKCRCDCGGQRTVEYHGLTAGTRTSCGCVPRPRKPRTPSPRDLTGKRFGRLVVVERLTRDRFNQWSWQCRCDCGNVHVSKGYVLREGRCKSCGCLPRDIAKARKKK